jgi:hypothetical protein
MQTVIGTRSLSPEQILKALQHHGLKAELTTIRHRLTSLKDVFVPKEGPGKRYGLEASNPYISHPWTGKPSKKPNGPLLLGTGPESTEGEPMLTAVEAETASTGFDDFKSPNLPASIFESE